MSEPLVSKMGPRAGQRASGMCSGALLFVVEAPRRAFGKASPKGFDCSPNVVDQLRAATDQRFARADDRHMSLGIFTSVLEWVEQFRIKTCEASEVLGIDLICFAFVGVDMSLILRALATSTS